MKHERGVDEDAAPLDVVARGTLVDLVLFQLVRGFSQGDRNPREEDAPLSQLFPCGPRKRDRVTPRILEPAVEGAGQGELEGELVSPLHRRHAGPVVVNRGRQVDRARAVVVQEVQEPVVGVVWAWARGGGGRTTPW